MANDDIAMKMFVSNDEGTYSLFEWDLKQCADWGE